MEDETAGPDPLTKAALASLKDIGDPMPVSWMPQTWGWLFLAVVLGLAVLLYLAIRYRRYKADAYRREALRILDKISIRLEEGAGRRASMQEVAALVKRVALVRWARKDIASLTGTPWITFLHANVEAADIDGIEPFLGDGEYRPDVHDREQDIDQYREAISAARLWIERHHVPA